MGSGASKKEEEKVVKVDGVNEYDNSMSIVNVHANTVWYMSTIFIMVIAIVVCVYLYVKRGSFCCSPQTTITQLHDPGDTSPTQDPGQ